MRTTQRIGRAGTVRPGAGGAIVALLLLAAATGAVAQEVRTAVVPDSIHVGDVFRVAVRVVMPEGATVSFPDTLAVPENVEAAARVEVSVDTAADGSVSHTAVYPLAAWRTGPVELPATRIPVTLARGESAVEATFPPIRISTLLPADTAELDPRPPRDVIGPSRLLWPFVLAAVILLAVLAFGIRAWRRRRPRADPSLSVLPRDAALTELDRIRKLGYLERNELKAFYPAVASVLRRYTAQLDPGWGAQLTTTELWQSMQRALAGPAPVPAARQPGTAADESNEAVELYSMLGRADLVKFARSRPAVVEAHDVWAEARRWVEQFPPPEPEAVAGEEV
jgi:hypothetical protein